MNTLTDRFTEMITQRIWTARKEAKLTQKELSDRLGFKDRQTLATIEAGTRKLSAEEMLKLVDILGKDLSYFTDPYLIVEPNIISWRAQNTPVVLDQYEAKARKLISANRRFADLLQEKPEPLDHVLPLTKKSSFEEAAATGEELAQRWDMGDKPATRLQAVAEEKLHYQVLFVDAPKEISGAACHQAGFETVLINRNEFQERRNFDLGHELFHLLTWATMPPGRIDVSYDENPNRAPRIERLADNFAAGLLMPSHILKPRLDSRDGIELNTWIIETARELQVSGQALYWRLRNLKWLSDGDAMDVHLDRLSQARQDESRTGSQPCLYSAMFVKRLHEVLDQGLVSVRKAAELLDCSVEDLEDLFNKYNLKVPFDL